MTNCRPRSSPVAQTVSDSTWVQEVAKPRRALTTAALSTAIRVLALGHHRSPAAPFAATTSTLLLRMRRPLRPSYSPGLSPIICSIFLSVVADRVSALWPASTIYSRNLSVCR